MAKFNYASSLRVSPTNGLYDILITKVRVVSFQGVGSNIHTGLNDNYMDTRIKSVG